MKRFILISGLCFGVLCCFGAYQYDDLVSWSGNSRQVMRHADPMLSPRPELAGGSGTSSRLQASETMSGGQPLPGALTTLLIGTGLLGGLSFRSRRFRTGR